MSVRSFCRDGTLHEAAKFLKKLSEESRNAVYSVATAASRPASAKPKMGKKEPFAIFTRSLSLC